MKLTLKAFWRAFWPALAKAVTTMPLWVWAFACGALLATLGSPERGWGTFLLVFSLGFSLLVKLDIPSIAKETARIKEELRRGLPPAPPSFG